MGGQITFVDRELVQAADPRGRALWQQIFPFEDGGYCPVPRTGPTFQADGAAAFLGVSRLCLADPEFAYVYAIQTGDGSTTPPPSSDTGFRGTFSWPTNPQNITARSSSGARRAPMSA